MTVESVYYSLPVNYPGRSIVLDTLKNDLFKIKGGNIGASWWEQNTYYNPNYLDNAQIFVFAMSDNKFNFSVEELPSGVKKELAKAIMADKSIYYLYKTVGSSIPNYYRVNIDLKNRSVRGIAGSSAEFWSEVLKESITLEEASKVIKYHLPTMQSNNAENIQAIKKGEEMHRRLLENNLKEYPKTIEECFATGDLDRRLVLFKL